MFIICCFTVSSVVGFTLLKFSSAIYFFLAGGGIKKMFSYNAKSRALKKIFLIPAPPPDKKMVVA
jgi:predicted membrane protein